MNKEILEVITMNKLKVGDKVKATYEPIKEKYNGIYEIKEIKIDINGVELYKLKGIPGYATKDMIEKVGENE